MLVEAIVTALAALACASPYHTLGGLLQARSTSISSGCGTDGPASCTANPPPSNLCCYESPGGLLVLTQFWDTNPSTGPSKSWTIHGLWPDQCDNTFSENCDPSRDYTDISGLLTAQGASDTLNFMDTYWVNNNGNNEEFWEHGWATHGTCYSTLIPSCLPSDSPTGAEAVAFFQTVVKLFKQYNIYSALETAGITPSSGGSLDLSVLQGALKSAFGVTPAFYCSSATLNEVYIYFNLKGSVIDGEFTPIEAPTAGNCPSSKISYPPKS